MRVTIVAWQQHTFTIEVGQQEPVLEIKRTIERIIGIPSASLTLSVSDWELVDGLDLEDYPIIQEGTIIHLSVNSIVHFPLNKIKILLTFVSNQFNVMVDATETISGLKEKIQAYDGMRVNRQSLYFGGTELEDHDHRNLRELGIGDFSEIIVSLKDHDPKAGRINFTVQTSSNFQDGAIIPLEMSDSNTVEEMKHFLVSRGIIPRLDYIFIHNQTVMHERCSLGQHGVENGDTLYLFRGTVYRGPLLGNQI